MKKQYILTLSLFLFIITSMSCKKPDDTKPDENVPGVNAGRVLKHVFTDENYIKSRTFYYMPNGLVDSSVFLYDDNRKFCSKFYYDNNRIDYYSGPVFGLQYINWGARKNIYIYDSDSNVIKMDFKSKSSKDDHLDDFTFTYNSDNRISSFKEKWNFTFEKRNYVWNGDNISEEERIQDYWFHYGMDCDINCFIVPIYKSYYTFDLSLNNDLNQTYDNKIFKPKYLNKNLISSEIRCIYKYDFNMDSCTIVLDRIDTVLVNYSYEFENGRVSVIKQNGVVTDSISYYK